MGLFSKFSKGLSKTREGLVGGISSVIKGKRIDEDVLEELEEQLILCDIGVETAEHILESLEQTARRDGQVTETAVIDLLKKELVSALVDNDEPDMPVHETPFVISVVGVNGVGKTTTIGKLAYQFSQQGKSVMMAAADTFRAAAIEQLGVWAQRSNVHIVQTQMGADPAAVAFDALQSAISKEIDVLLIDTAGRLHNKSNLMNELEKIHRVLKKQVPNAPHEVLLVLDATTGQNGLAQAKQFSKAVPVTGIALTKLDGTAKGGIIFSIHKELGIPVRYVGLGEGIEDLESFNSNEFVEALFS